MALDFTSHCIASWWRGVVHWVEHLLTSLGSERIQNKRASNKRCRYVYAAERNCSNERRPNRTSRRFWTARGQRVPTNGRADRNQCWGIRFTQRLTARFNRQWRSWPRRRGINSILTKAPRPFQNSYAARGLGPSGAARSRRGGRVSPG